MRLYTPLCDGDSTQRPDAAIGEAIAGISSSPAAAASFVHSNIVNEAAMKVAPEVQEIEMCERAARNAWIAGTLNSIRHAVADWLARHDNSERGYIGAARLTDIAQPQRDFARAELSRYMFTDC